MYSAHCPKAWRNSQVLLDLRSMNGLWVVVEEVVKTYLNMTIDPSDVLDLRSRFCKQTMPYAQSLFTDNDHILPDR